MTSYQQDSIKLEEAMSMEFEKSILALVWNVSGLQVTEKNIPIPENATKIKTLVMKYTNGVIAVWVEWTAKKREYTKPVAAFCSLEELKDEFPQLFELEGYVYTLH